MSALRILYLGPWSGTSRHRVEAMRRLGHEVVVKDPRTFCPATSLVDRWIWRTGGLFLTSSVAKNILTAIDGEKFDLIYVSGGELISPALVQSLKKRNVPVISYNIDDPFGGRDSQRWRQYLASVPFYDLNVVVRECNAAEALKAGAKRVLHVTMAADELAHSPRVVTEDDRSRLSSEVNFMGTWMPERGPFMSRLIELGVPLSIWGHRWEKAPEWPVLQSHLRGQALMDTDSYAKGVQCAKVCLGLLSKGNRDQSTTRSFEIPLLGGVLCAERTAEHLELYREDEEAVFWSTPEECASKCLALLKDDAWRQRLSQNGRARCIANGSTNEPIMRKILETAFAN